VGFESEEISVVHISLILRAKFSCPSAGKTKYHVEAKGKATKVSIGFLQSTKWGENELYEERC
jgi:hypothetical protein